MTKEKDNDGRRAQPSAGAASDAPGPGAGQSIVNQGNQENQYNAGRDQHFHQVPRPRPQPRKSNLPPPNPDFVGRREELERLHALLVPGTPVALDQRPGSLTGLGGVGKSQLAFRYGQLHEGEYEHICVVNAEGEDLSAAVADLARDPLGLGLDPALLSAHAAAAVLARLEQGGPHLLIFDNVDHPEAWRPWVPRGDVRVLITTRRTDLMGVSRIAVPTLPLSDALLLLRGPEPLADAAQEAACEALWRALEGLSLAVAVAGRVLASGAWQPSSLLAEIGRDVVEVMEAEDAPVFGKHPSLLRLFDASFAQLDAARPVDALASAMFRVGGWLAPVEVPLDLLAGAAYRLNKAGGARPSLCQSLSAWLRRLVTNEKKVLGSPEHGLPALDRLLRLGLVRLGEGGAPVFHRLLREYARHRGGPEAREAVLDELQARVDSTPTETLALLALAPLRPHLEEALAWLGPGASAQRGRIPLRLAQHLKHRGEYAQAQSACERALSWSPDPEWESYLLNEAGQALDHQGRSGEALEYYERSLAITVKVLGEQHPDTASTLNAIGQALASQGRYGEALEYYERSLAIKVKVLGEQHPDTAITLHAIGQALDHQGRYGEALEYYERSLAIMVKVLGEQHPDTAITLNAIGQALDHQGRSGEALEYYERDLAIKVKVLGEQHPDTASTLNAIGQALDHQGRSGEALEYYERDLAITVKVLGEQHPSTASTLLAIGQALHRQGRSGEALEYYERSLAIKVKVLGEQHPETAMSRFELGRARRDTGDAAGRAQMVAATRQLEAALGADHPTVRAARSWLK